MNKLPEDDYQSNLNKEHTLGNTTSNILSNIRTYANSGDINKPISQLSHKREYFGKNDTIPDQSVSILNEQAYFKNRSEITLFGKRLFSISHDNYGLTIICNMSTDKGWGKIF